MRRFRFPLARLQRLRLHAERHARRELAAALAETARLEARLATVQSSLSSCRAEDGAAIPLARALEDGLARTAVGLRSELATSTRMADEARARYQERRRELETIERLQQRRWTQWRREGRAAEQAEAEELARMLRATQRRRP